MNIFEKSCPNRVARGQIPKEPKVEVSAKFLRQQPPKLPEVSELEAVRHYSQLARKNFCIDNNFFPLGSCTMKYNPRGVHKAVQYPGLLKQHPLAPDNLCQGTLQCLYELQDYLITLTGMKKVALSPMAGAQGEFAGVAMIKAYHASRNDAGRNEMLVPDAAHGTNPASAVMCGFKVKEIPTLRSGDINIEALKQAVGPQTAGIMLTNPSTLGVFERQILSVQKIIHDAGGLLYYDGANLNAILGKVRPGDMGFDVIHMNLHKTFATPHGGGGPGSGPVAVNEKLIPFLPVPVVGKTEQNGDTVYSWQTDKDYPQTIGKLSAFMGNVGILLRAYSYIRMLGKSGVTRVSEYATLNANYLMQRLKNLGYQVYYSDRRATHEFIISFTEEKKTYNVTAQDLGKRMLDYGCYAPTTYFPLLVPECLLIEPTETESKQTLDRVVDIWEKILTEIRQQPELLRSAPNDLPCKRVDEVQAARQLELIYKAET